MSAAIHVTLLLDGRVLIQRHSQIIEVQPEELAELLTALRDAEQGGGST
jgi:hypothetical protein